MQTFNYWKVIALGFLVWLVPFLVSFLFYTPGGNISIDLQAFKTVMLLTSQAVGAITLWYYFRSARKDFVRTGLIVGFVWLLVNWALDFLTLILMFQQPLGQYFLYTGLLYLGMPITTTLLGVLLAQKVPEPETALSASR